MKKYLITGLLYVLLAILAAWMDEQDLPRGRFENVQTLTGGTQNVLSGGLASDGDVAAIRWWEMTRQGRSEKTQTEAKVEVTNDAIADARLARIVEETAAQLAQENHLRIAPSVDA